MSRKIGPPRDAMCRVMDRDVAVYPDATSPWRGPMERSLGGCYCCAWSPRRVNAASSGSASRSCRRTPAWQASPWSHRSALARPRPCGVESRYLLVRPVATRSTASASPSNVWHAERSRYRANQRGGGGRPRRPEIDRKLLGPQGEARAARHDAERGLTCEPRTVNRGGGGDGNVRAKASPRSSRARAARAAAYDHAEARGSAGIRGQLTGDARVAGPFRRACR
jgi:hypothetical protein